MSPTPSTSNSSPPQPPGVLLEIVPALRMLLVLTAVTGILYPLFVTGIAHLAFPRQAEGSLIIRQGRVLGSSWIGQPFSDPRYFWGRLSATTPPCDASSSSGSNRGPLNPALVHAAEERIEALRAADPGNHASIPVDLVTASASGLDPHVSVAAAEYQAARVARTRGIPLNGVRAAVARHTTRRFLGVIGEPVVNVLELNLDLDGVR